MAWNKLAEFIKDNLKKGDQVLIQGQLKYRKYEDSNGKARFITEIVASEFMKIYKS